MTARLPGPYGGSPVEDIIDAEFVELDDDGHIGNAAPHTANPNAEYRRAVWQVVLLIIGAGLVYLIGVPVYQGFMGMPVAGNERPMAEELTYRITGRQNEAGLVMSAGPGTPGSVCDLNTLTQLMVFGDAGPNASGQPVPDNAFRMAMTEGETLIFGDYWFNRVASTITISGSAIVDPDGKPLQQLPDSTISILPRGDGYLDFRGTRFHECRAL